MKATYKQITTFRAYALDYLNTNKEHRTKFHYALEKVLKSTTKAAEDWEEIQEELRMKYVSVNEKGNIEREPTTKGYAFKPDKLTELTKEINKRIKDEIEVEPYIASFIPEDLSYFQIEAFTLFVMNELPEPKLPENKLASL